MEKIDSFSFYVVRTAEDANVEMDVKVKLESILSETAASVFIPLRQSKARIGGAVFSHLEMAMPNYVFILNSGMDENTSRKIKKIHGVEELLVSSSSDSQEPAAITWKEMSRFIKATPSSEDIRSLYSDNTYVVFGTNAGARCRVKNVENGLASVTIELKKPIDTTLPVWYLGKEETQ